MSLYDTQNDSRIRKIKFFHHKELISDDIQPVTNFGKFLICIFDGDACQSIPNFHILDYDTLGNKISASYSLESGQYLKHGCVDKPLNKKDLRSIVKHIDNKVWSEIIRVWNCCNRKKVKKFISIPDFSNSKE